MSAAVTRALRTPAQNNRMHGLLAQLRRTGLDDDGAKVLLRDLCRQYSGQDHSSRLSRAEADLVIRALQGRGVTERSTGGEWTTRFDGEMKADDGESRCFGAMVMQGAEDGGGHDEIADPRRGHDGDRA